MLVHHVIESYSFSERRSCSLFGLARTAYRYQVKPKDDDTIQKHLSQLAKDKPRWGFQKMFQRLKAQGHRWNHKRVYRVYCELSLNLRKKPKKRFPSRNPKPLLQPLYSNISWSMDFMRDSLESGDTYRTLNIIDDFNREILGIEIDRSLPTERVTRKLDCIAEWRGYPKKIRMDNGPEFISHKLLEWAVDHEVILDFIKPGKPAQNAYIERFNRTYRDDILDFYLFSDLDEVRDKTTPWMYQYNRERPHESLGNKTPYEFLMARQ